MRTSTVDTWVFLLADDPDAWHKNADETEFRPVRIPHDWSVEGDFDPSCSSGTGYLPGGVGWYRSHSSIEALRLSGAAAVRLVFHGVYKNAQVWVNGYHLGRRPSGHAEFWFDLTEIVSYAVDDDLVISVRVDHRDLADSRWYNGSGLTRRVEIEAHETVSLARHGTTVTTLGAEPTRAEVEVVQQLENHTDAAQVVLVDHVLHAVDRSSTEPRSFGRHRVDVAPRDRAELRTVLEVPDPLLWSDDHPDLYRLVTTIRTADGEDGEEIASHDLVVGLRTIELDPDRGFSVNGERRLLKGVCLHEDAGVLGTAVPAEVWLRRLLLLKAGGCNAVRMAHNPHAPELYDLCDLLGLYVIDEAFDEWENPKNKWWQGHNVYPPKHEGYAHDFHEWHVRDLEAMVDAHRHHPSVIAWSIGNEVDYPNDPYASRLFEQMTGNNDHAKPAAERVYDPNRPDIRRLTTIAHELIDVVKRRDDSRPVTLAAAFPELSATTGLLDRLDLVGYNYKEHLYVEDHRRFPDRPLVGSETSHSYAAWRQAADLEFVAGQFLWTGIDYLGETSGWPSHGSGAGLLTTAGFAKERWHLRRSWWSDEPVVRLAVRPVGSHGDWTFTRTWDPDAALEVACFTNADQVHVCCGSTPVPMVYDPDAGYWRGTLGPGEDLIVAQVEAGGTAAHDELGPAGPPVAVDATFWVAPQRWRSGVDRIAGGPADVHQLEYRLLDANGRPARGEVVVKVTVDGGDLLGLDNGDLSDTTPYRAQHRSTLDGRLIAYVRGSRATVSLEAAGLPAVVVGVPDD